MKQLLFLLLAFPAAARTQPEDVAPVLRLRQLYASFGVGEALPGSGGCLSAAGSFILSNHWGGSLRYNVIAYDAPNVPADYVPGLVLFGSSTPQDQLNIISFLLRYQWKLNPYIRAGVEAGPADVISDKRDFVPYTSMGWFSLASNYTEEVYTRTTLGLSLRGYMQFPIGRAFGLEAGLFTNINKEQSTVAIEGCLDFGYMRKRIKR